MSKPALFVGSSSEGLDLARAVRELLDEDAEVTLWKEGLFDLGSTFIDSLIKALPRFDFAAVMLTAGPLGPGAYLRYPSARRSDKDSERPRRPDHSYV
jgi:predicted nucleotide-binding protein